MQLLISGLVFAAVAVLAGVVLTTAFSEERQVRKALRSVSEWEGEQASVAEPLLLPFRSRVLSPMGGAVTGALRSMMPAKSRERMQHALDLAGDPGNLSPEGVAGLRLAGTVGGALLGGVVAVVARGGFSVLSVLAVVVLAVVGFLAPGLWLAQVGSSRQDEIRRTLPDMLDMLTISVQAGLGFDLALAKIVRNTEGPLAREFAHMLNEVQAGVSRRDALRHLGARTDAPELDAFIVAMVQADQFGVSISGILHTQSSELRKKRRQRAEEMAQKAPVKMVFPIICCILPATLLVILGPAIVAIGRAFGLIR
jgi:tight adherence protein C